MLFRKLTKWDETAKTPPLLFLVQLLEELLFEFSLDTYKASVMHTGLLCQEALSTIRQVESGNIKAPNIVHVAAELASNFEKDPVARSLVSLSASAFLPTLKNPKTPHKELQTVLELLSVQLTPKRYRLRNEEQLMQAVTEGASFSLIRRLARLYVTTLIARGVSARFQKEQMQEFFHYGAGRIAGPESLNSFFKLFPFDASEYIIVFKVDKIFEHVIPAFSTLTQQSPI